MCISYLPDMVTHGTPSSGVAVDGAAEDPQAGHDFVPVQVGALQVS